MDLQYIFFLGGGGEGGGQYYKNDMGGDNITRMTLQLTTLPYKLLFVTVEGLDKSG